MLLRPAAPLAAYLKGLYLFACGVCEAFEEALSTPRSRRNARALSWRLAEAAHFYFDGLTHAVRNDLTKVRHAPRELGAHLEELFFAAAYLHEQIAKLSRTVI